MRGRSQKWVWVMLCAWLSACGGASKGDDNSSNQTPPASSAGKEKSCEEVCELADSCGYEEESCVEDCADNESLSRAGQDAVATCLGDLSCEPDETDFLSALLCVTDELEDIELSSEQKKFCSDTTSRLQECTDFEPDDTLGDCEMQAVLLSDEVLSEINSCDQTDCQRLQTCLALQIFQNVDIVGLTEVDDSGEISAATLADLLALVVLGSQLGDLGQDTGGLLGGGGGSP